MPDTTDSSCVEELFHSVLAHTAEPCLVTSSDGLIQHANPPAMLLLGVESPPTGHELGRYFQQSNEPLSVSASSPEVMETRLIPGGRNGESPGRTEPCTLRQTCCGDNTLILVEPQWSNVALETALPEMLRTLPVAIHIVDDQWCLLDANQAWFQLTGYRRADVIGKRWLDRLDMTNGALEDLQPVFEQHETVHGLELTYETTANESIQVQVSASPMESEDGQCFAIVTAVDIEDRKERAEALEKSRDSARAANQAKNAFLANMSHELRTPLNGILGYAQILGRDQSLAAQHRRAINTIRESGEYLLTLINDILDLAKLESNKVEAQQEPIQVFELVNSVVDLARTRARRKGLSLVSHIDSEVSAIVLGDGRMIRQVLLNLLGNAVKYTAQGGITITVEQESHENIKFTVDDTGPGIPPDQQALIFEPFEQSDSSGRTAGAGLGLAISSQLVKVMGGTLELDSTPGEGSRFSFTLPLPVASPTQVRRLMESYRRRVGYHGPTLRVMIVDDRRENRVVMSNMLTPLGFEVLTATDGSQALQRIKKDPPDVVLMDLVMPELDGFEAIRRLRADETLRNLKVIAFSASVFEDDRTLSLNAGADAFIPKPVNLEHLLDELGELLDLEWDEQDMRIHAPSKAGEHHTPGELIPIPTENLSLLHDAASAGRILDVRRELEDLHALSEDEGDEKFHPFLNHLESLVDRFDLEGVCDFIDSFRPLQDN